MGVPNCIYIKKKGGGFGYIPEIRTMRRVSSLIFRSLYVVFCSNQCLTAKGLTPFFNDFPYFTPLAMVSSLKALEFFLGCSMNINFNEKLAS